MPSNGLPTPARYWSVLAIGLAVTLAVLDGVIANVALPTITEAVGATPANTVWVINGYQIAIVVTLLPLAAIGEAVSYRVVYIAGLGVFTIASLGCALSHTLPTLIAWRVVQGLGGAGIMSMNGALVRFTYPRNMLGRGVGLNAVIVALASALGPTIASAVLSVASWEWLFAINVPLGILALVVGWRSLPVTARQKRSLDVVSMSLNAAAVALVLIGGDGFSRGESSMLVAATILAGIVAGVLLVRRERGLAQPLVPLDLLRIPIFALSMAASVASFTAQMAAFVALPFALEHEMHRTAVQTGLLMTPWPLGVAVIAPVAGRLSDRMPAAYLGSAGLAIMSLGLVLLAWLGTDASNADIVWRMAICGLGAGLFQSPNNRILLSSAPRERAGSAGGLLATARLVGQTCGAMVAAFYLRILPETAGHASLYTGAAVAALAACISLSRKAVGPPARAETRTGS